MKIKTNIHYHLCFIFVFVCIVSCNNKRNIPFPQNVPGELVPVSKPLHLSAEKPLNWETINPDSITQPETIAFNINKLPVKPFTVNDFKPLKNPIETVQVNWDSIPDSTFTLDPKDAMPFTLQKSILPNPEITPASAPVLMPNTTSGFLQFSDQEGLPGSFVFSSLTDKDGKLWLATNNALSIYNGDILYTYTFFIDSNNVTSTSNFIYSMTEDLSGRIWSVTGGGDIYIIDQKNRILSHYTSSLFITNIIIDHDGNIWLATFFDGIYFIDKNLTAIQKVKFTDSPEYDQKAYVVMEDRDNNIWIGNDNRICIINPERKRIKKIGRKEGLILSSVVTLYEDSSQNVWIGNIAATELTSFSLKNKAISKIIVPDSLGNYPLKYKEDKRGQLWIVRNNSILILNKQRTRTKVIKASDITTFPGFPSFSEDAYGNFWIGSTIGEIIFDPNGPLPEHLDSKNGLADNLVAGHLEDNKGNIWIGTSKGINIYEPSKNQIRLLSDKQGLKHTMINGLRQIDELNMLAASYYGFAIINIKNQTLTNYGKGQGFKANLFFNGIEDNLRNVWINSDIGIYIFNLRNNTLKKGNKKSGLLADGVWDFLKDDKGNLWAASDSGVMIINPVKSTVQYLRQEEGLCNNVVSKIMLTNSGEIWIGTNKGISIVNPERNTITNIIAREGMVPELIYDLAEQNNEIYGASANGIIAITKPGSMRNLHKWGFTNYGKSSGFPYNNYTQTSATTTKQGEIWWAVTPGVTVFTQAIATDTVAPKTIITGIQILGHDLNTEDYSNIKSYLQPNDTIWDETKNTSYQKSTLPKNSGYLVANKISYDSLSPFYNLPVKLVLPYNQNALSFSYTNNNAAGRDKIVYQYIVEGADTSWSAVTDKTMTINYYNLSPGEYNFKVRSKGMNNVWSQPAEFDFTIQPPWWKTWLAYLLYAGLAAGILWLSAQYRSRLLQKENRLLEEKVSQRTTQLNKSIEELKFTQAQLIQSEKMASLGELTAGIAHEIRNPLNFVNNFSEVNKELIEEIQSERLRINGERDEQLQDELLNSIKENEEKINHHGKRADAIVKGMLQHSQKNEGQKEPTDINALCDEYLRLSFHGMRAKDKSFNANFKADFDRDLSAVEGKINIVPQDIGRVLLNLYNNAFYAVAEKKKQQPGGYEPTVSVETKKIGDNVEIKVADNGNGIPQKILDKIFQPFFTTKPAGQGIGLGLSLSYDIIKANGGEISVGIPLSEWTPSEEKGETKEGEGTIFTIQLPVV